MLGAHEVRGAADLLNGILRDLGTGPVVTAVGGSAQLIRRGSKGAPAFTVQKLINAWIARARPAVTPLQEDGAFGPLTEKAVKAFQQSAGLSADGIVGPKTWPALLGKALPRSAGAAIAGDDPDLVVGLDASDVVCLLPETPNPADTAILPLFNAVVNSNALVARPITLNSRFKNRLVAYSLDNPVDGAILMLGFLRCPRFFDGGWILKLQPHAKAMTLDKAVFVDGALDIDTYVHELVHVGQYRVLGISGFLVSYFGLSAATILARWLRGVPISAMTSSPHETQAYDVARRFMAWFATHP
jgi:hypothetical protein